MRVISHIIGSLSANVLQRLASCIAYLSGKGKNPFSVRGKSIAKGKGKSAGKGKKRRLVVSHLSDSDDESGSRPAAGGKFADSIARTSKSKEKHKPAELFRKVGKVCVFVVVGSYALYC